MLRAAAALAVVNLGVAVCIAGMRRDRPTIGETMTTLAVAVACFAVALGVFVFSVLLPLAAQY